MTDKQLTRYEDWQVTWEDDQPIPDAPPWCEGITGYNVASIQQSGCASGAWMPAVTYHEALETMANHGDDVFEFIEDYLGLGELPPPQNGESWSGMAVHYLSCAVELWAGQFEVVDAESEVA